ncbi:hypothetical protein OROMI_014372 [Orobanche minor]
MDNHNGKRQRIQDTSNGDITTILKSTTPVSIITNAAITSEGNEKSSYVLQSVRRRIVAFEPNIYMFQEKRFARYSCWLARQRRRNTQRTYHTLLNIEDVKSCQEKGKDLYEMPLCYTLKQ